MGVHGSDKKRGGMLFLWYKNRGPGGNGHAVYTLRHRTGKNRDRQTAVMADTKLPVSKD
jgi:hypothetical protein